MTLITEAATYLNRSRSAVQHVARSGKVGQLPLDCIGHIKALREAIPVSDRCPGHGF